MGQKLRIDPGACILGALALLVLPLNWLLAALCAAGFHELCHFSVIRLTGGEVRSLTVRTGGAVMEVPPMDRRAELLCAAAGPMGSFLLLGLARWFPRLALCGFVQGCFNLLPIYPMDGGRIVSCLLPKGAKTVETVILTVLFCVLITLSLCCSPGFLLPLALLARKIPCKRSQERVQ